MVQRMLGQDKNKEMHGMWFATTTFPPDVHISYSYERIVPPTQESSRELHALLYGLPSDLGIRQTEWYEDIFSSTGDSTED